MFKHDNVIKSDWYIARLKKKIALDKALMNRHLTYLNNIHKGIVKDSLNHGDIEEIERKIQWAHKELDTLNKENSYENLVGTIGADLLYKY
jgi:hypothetical protein